MKNKYFFHTAAMAGLLWTASAHADAVDADTAAWLGEAVKTAKTFDYNTIETYPDHIAPYMGDADPEHNRVSGFDSYMKAFNAVYSPDQAKENKNKMAFISLSDVQVSPSAIGEGYQDVKAKVRFESFRDFTPSPDSRAAQLGLNVESGPRCSTGESELILVLREANGKKSIMQWIELPGPEAPIACAEAKALQLDTGDLEAPVSQTGTAGE